MFRAARNDPHARFIRAALWGLSTGHALLPDSWPGRFLERRLRIGTSRSKQIRYSHENRRILTLRRDSLWSSAMPTLLAAAPADAPRASERRQENESSRPSRLYPISSRDQDAVSTCAGLPQQNGVRRYYRPTPRLSRSRVRPSPAGEDRRQCLSVSRTPSRHHNKRLRSHQSFQELIQTIYSFFTGSTMHLGNAIKICRAHRGLTQAQLAKEAGISLSYLSLLEHDKRDANVSTLESIARGLRIPLNLLVFLASEGGELQGLPEDVRDRLASVILRLLNEPRTTQASLSL